MKITKAYLFNEVVKILNKRFIIKSKDHGYNYSSGRLVYGGQCTITWVSRYKYFGDTYEHSIVSEYNISELLRRIYYR